MTSGKPRFDFVCGDEMTGLRIGQVVQEAELDARVRAHPYLAPGEAFVIDHEALGDIAPEAWRVVP